MLMPQQRTERPRIDLSVAQVAASALATIVGALLASELGVYGTILGAAVVSVGATTGSAVFQHWFRRGGEQLRQVVDRTQGSKQEPLPETTGPSGEWNEPTTVRAKRRWTWRTYLAASGLVFVLAMVPIVSFELITGQPVAATVKGEQGAGTSFGGTVEKSTPPPGTPSQEERPGATPSGSPSGTPSGKPSGSPSSSPSSSSSPSGSPTPSPSPTPTPSPTPSPTPEPTPSPTPSGQPAAGLPSGSPSA
ncbi:hypothetical protein ACIA8O_38215 [Kitasatospora sp. NPDC051853]|uniref:hypothetical protein n=1 Tax=Kitasatospora sp. NPDC051853 TaxID=3364058 RepID=UPI0037A252AD